MAAGLVERYQRAGVTPPIVLNVDCGCCKEVGETKLKIHFSEWPDLIIRLDIWHLMLHLAVYHRRPSTVPDFYGTHVSVHFWVGCRWSGYTEKDQEGAADTTKVACTDQEGAGLPHHQGWGGLLQAILRGCLAVNWSLTIFHMLNTLLGVLWWLH